MPGAEGEGMAPLMTPSGVTERTWLGEGPRLLRRLNLYPRQDTGSGSGSDSGRNRFGFGNNNGGGDRNSGDSNGDGRGRGFFRGGRKGDGAGGSGGDSSGNGNGNGRGNDNGNGSGNSNGDGNGNGSGGGDGNGRGGGNGFGFGNRFGDRFGDGGGRGNNRGGGGSGRDRNGNNGDTNTSPTSSSPAETPSSSPLPELPSESPQPTSSAEPAASSTEPAPAAIETSSEFNPGVILLQSAVTGNPTAEANPTVTQFIPLMSASDAAGENVESVDASSGAGLSVLPGPTPFPNSPPTGGPMDNNTPNNNSGGADGAGNRLEVAQAGMDPTAERILISVGSIGGFILLCFITWMVWRTMKKSRRDGYAGGDAGGFPRRVASKIPFFRRRGWQNLDDSTVSRSPPPSYREKTGSARAPSVAGFYGSEKMQVQQPPQQPWPQNNPEVVVLPGHGSMQPGIMYQPPPNPRNTYTAADRPHITLMTNIPAAYSHQAQGSFSSTNAAHFGAIMTPDNTASPIHSGVSPASYYNQPLLNQQFTVPYNPLYRQPSRTISEVSSLSSGFGDGDIIVTDPLITTPAPTAVPGSSATNSPQQQHQQYTTRFSWMSQPHGGGGPAAAGQTTPPTRQNSNASASRRETVYTETSEDQPARFRSVTSWVDQQTGRIRRVQKQQQGGAGAAAGGGNTAQGGQQAPGNPGIPGIHNPPREQSFGMMMDDEEAPRRVEEVVGLGRAG